MMPLLPAQVRALRDLHRAYPTAAFAIIGAVALAFHVRMHWRHTADLDLVIAISVAELDLALSRLPGWTRNKHHEQRWEAPDHVLLDMVPAPPEALRDGQLIWLSGHEMSLAGLRLALHTTPVSIAEGLSVAVATAPVIVLLKMAAYLDRPWEREKDLKDIAHILDEFPSVDDDERFFSDDILGAGLDEPRARCVLLGRDLRGLVDEVDRRIVQRFFRELVDGSRWGHFLSQSPWRDREDELRQRVEAFRGAFFDQGSSAP